MVVKVLVTPKPHVPDPQRNAKLAEVRGSGFSQVSDVRQGKYFEIELDTDDRRQARSLAKKMCKELLTSPAGIEEYSVEIVSGGNMSKKDRGFASMDVAKQREIASKGGRAAHQKGTAHEWTIEEAREAGKKGGQASHANKGKAK